MAGSHKPLMTMMASQKGRERKIVTMMLQGGANADGSAGNASS